MIVFSLNFMIKQQKTLVRMAFKKSIGSFYTLLFEIEKAV